MCKFFHFYVTKHKYFRNGFTVLNEWIFFVTSGVCPVAEEIVFVDCEKRSAANCPLVYLDVAVSAGTFSDRTVLCV